MAGGAVAAAPRQRRRRAPGSRARASASRCRLRTVERAVAPFRRELRRRRWRRFALKRRPASSCRSTSARRRCAIGGERVQGAPVRGHARLFAPRRTWRCSCTSGSRRGGKGSKGRFITSAVARAKCCSTTRRRWSSFHDAQTREVRFNERFHAFCRYWDVTPKACAPYRARTKGKDERGVGYVKRNAIAGHRFESLAAAGGAPRVVDARGGRRARARHHRRGSDRALRARGSGGVAAAGRAKAPFQPMRECVRRVHADACIELDTNRYSVPWRLIGETRHACWSSERGAYRCTPARKWRATRGWRVSAARRFSASICSASSGAEPRPRRRRPTVAARRSGRTAAPAAGIRSGDRRCLVKRDRR